MRSSLVLAVVLSGCATTAQTEQCFPSASWATPIFRCGIAAAPKPPEPKPEPTPEPKPEPQPEPEPPPKVEVKADKIELKEKVNFETASDVLVPESKTLLDEVAKTLDDHPEIKKVRIDGHTDSVASLKYNQKLSDKRAKAVKAYLVSKGVAAKRLDSKGWGESKPVADNKTEEGREANRRVEIKILARSDGEAAATTSDEPRPEKPAKKEKKKKKKKKGAKAEAESPF